MSSQRFVQNPWLTDDLTTANATPTVSAATSYVVPSGASGYVEVTAVLKDASQNTASVKVSRSFKNVSGVLSLVGTLSSLLAINGDAGLVTAVLGLTTSGTTVQPQVTGIAATSIEWLISAKYYVH